MTRRRALIICGIAALAIGGALEVLDIRMMNSGGPGIVGFEFAGTADRAAEILADWGSRGQEAARASLWIDYAYIAAYGTFLVLASAATLDLARERGWERMAAVGVAAVPFAAAAAAFDVIEDFGLLLGLDRHGGDAALQLARICASLKFLLLAVVIVYLVTGLVLRLRGREKPAGEAPG